jgi:predicted TIM-barrel fold metal-dependent hydrolase
MSIDLADVKVVDADTHMTEAHDLWTSRAPAALLDDVPRVEEVDGAPAWVMQGTLIGPALGGAVIRRDGTKGPAFEALKNWRLEEVHEGAYDMTARLAVMDEAGISTQIVFPNNFGLGGQHLANAVKDPELLSACIEIYNDANAELQAASGNRLLPLAVMPAWDIEGSVREAQRAAKLGFRGVNITSDPQDQGAPDLASRAWDPLWEVCAEAKLPVHFHIGASQTTMTYFGTYPWDSHNDDIKYGIGGTLLFIGNARVVVNIICSGMLERHPELKVVSVESGAGWVPFILEALDYELQENAPKDRAKMELSPKEIFRRQIYATMWFERTNLPQLIEAVGEDNILFETDYPHPTCLYPDPLTSALDNMRELTPEAQGKILGGNATKLYRL